MKHGQYGMRGSARGLGALLVPVMTGLALVVAAEMPFTSRPLPAAPYDYGSYLFIDGNDDLPVTFGLEASWWLTDSRSEDAQLRYNPQELYGVRGMGVNKAWQVSTGRPDVVVAIIDSGTRWNQTEECWLLRKYFLNRHELPCPAGGPNPDDTRFGGWDVNGDGVFNVEDYWDDPAVRDLNGNSWVDPEDLILTFSDGVDDDDNGYVDDISGWDFFENDNSPQDDVDHGHGSHQAGHAAAEAAMPGETCPGDPEAAFERAPGTCPNCMVLPLRVGDSFVADVNHFAEAVVYAVDNGAAVVETALGTLNHTSFGQEAVDYAYGHGVIVNASAADEASGHHNWPAAYEHTTVHNSLRRPELPFTSPPSFLFLNGCTNFGAHILASVPSYGCSSQATGLASGLSGLLVSAAKNAIEHGDMTPYVRDDGSHAPFALSAEEMTQLWRLAADDVDFSTAYPDHAFSDLWPSLRPDLWWGDPLGDWNDYGVSVPLVNSRRYQTVRGWDYFTGYGRVNAARLLRFIGFEDRDGLSREYLADEGPYGVGEDPTLTAQDRIPPEADITWPRRWHQYGHDAAYRLLLPDDASDPGRMVVRGRVAANRVTAAGGRFDYVLEWAPGVQGPPSPEGLGLEVPESDETSAGPWYEAARVTGLAAAFEGELGRIDVAAMAAALAATPSPFAAEGDPTGPHGSEQWGVRLRLRVLAHPANGADTVNNEAVQIKQVDVYPAAELVLRDDLGRDGMTTGGTGSPSLHDIDGDGVDELLLPTDDGLVHAFTDLVAGEELPGWPVRTARLGTLPAGGDTAYSRGQVSDDARGSLLVGTVAAVDLDDDGVMEVLAADLEGRLYAWNASGELRQGFPVTVDYGLSREPACDETTIPQCDDAAVRDLRNPANSRDWGFYSAPSVGDLDPGRPGLEIVAAAGDSHLYAWHADGTAVDGWPVVLRDPATVATMDPVTRVFSYAEGVDWMPGSKALTTPSLADLDADGDLEVVANVNEEYVEEPNGSFGDDTVERILELAGTSGNTRVYALHHTGAATAVGGAAGPSAHTQDQAYLAGWPVPIACGVLDLLPTAAQGSTTQPAVADVDGNGMAEVITAAHFGPGYVLDHDGSSFLGDDGSVYRTLERGKEHFGSASDAADDPSMPALGGMAVGSTSADGHLSIAAGGVGVLRMLDNALPSRQLGAEDHLDMWNAATGAFEPGAPLVVDDLQFFATPVIADITGDGVAEVIQGTSSGDLVSLGRTDAAEDAVVRHTGGWHMASPAVGKVPLGSLDQGTLHLVSMTREGYLRVWATATPDHAGRSGPALAQWPEAGHDAANSGHLHRDAERPGPVTGLVATVRGRALELAFRATGDDRSWERPARYEVRSLAGAVDDPRWQDGTPVVSEQAAPQPPGATQRLLVPSLEPGIHTVLVRARDEAGNGSAVAAVVVHMPPSSRDGAGRLGSKRTAPAAAPAR